MTQKNMIAKMAAVGAAVACGLGVGMAPAQATTASQGVATSETQEATSEVAELTFDHLDENGFTASVANGSVTKQPGGSVVIVDEDGAVAGEFSTATLLEDGTVRNIEYQVDGNEIVASYDSPVVEGVMPVSMQNCTPEWIMMAGAGAATIGAAATAPLTLGGSLVIGGAAAT
ncbi:hypothetical protein [Corynebacterium cystitidis]|nr:hypothetical protein [Corynebacterium cystitidis]